MILYVNGSIIQCSYFYTHISTLMYAGHESASAGHSRGAGRRGKDRAV